MNFAQRHWFGESNMIHLIMYGQSPSDTPIPVVLTADVAGSAAMTEISVPLHSYLGLGTLIDISSEEWLADDSESEEVIGRLPVRHWCAYVAACNEGIPFCCALFPDPSLLSCNILSSVLEVIISFHAGLANTKQSRKAVSTNCTAAGRGQPKE